jgi:hypothetical protein
MNWKIWLHGLVAAAIQSAATSVTLLVVDPTAFHDWEKLGSLCAVNAVLGVALYLKQSPIPKGAA